MEQNSLLNILGILIGFAGIMLILSLPVTAVTQAIIHGFQIRARRLHEGLARLLDLIEDKKGDDLANEVLAGNSLTKGPRGKETTWIDVKEFKMLLEEKEIISNDEIQKVTNWFGRMEKTVSQQFQLQVRKITLGCALIIALLFQVSAPDVLRRLARDPEYLAKVEKTVVAKLDNYESDYAAISKYEDVSAAALEGLQTNYPDLQEVLEEVSGVGDTKDNLLSELSLVLEGHPDKDNVLSDYEQLLEERHREGYNKAFEAAQSLTGELALLDITPLSKGLKFYCNIPNLLGILMSAVLIGLGAPFWFNILRNLVNLRDALSPPKSKKRPR